MKTLEEIIFLLPPELKQEVKDFAEYLLQVKARPKQKHLRLSWAGALGDMRDEYTSVELQHKALDWWANDVSH